MEVIDGFAGKLEKLFREKIRSDEKIDEIARNYPAGRRVVEAIETIAEEARAHGIRPEEPAPTLFPNVSDQAEFEKIRAKSLRIWEKLREVADLEDRAAKGIYVETEKLLAELKAVNNRYLTLALPCLAKLIGAPAERVDRLTSMDAGMLAHSDRAKT
jgi:hypothetical protein